MLKYLHAFTFVVLILGFVLFILLLLLDQLMPFHLSLLAPDRDELLGYRRHELIQAKWRTHTFHTAVDNPAFYPQSDSGWTMRRVDPNSVPPISQLWSMKDTEIDFHVSLAGFSYAVRSLPSFETVHTRVTVVRFPTLLLMLTCGALCWILRLRKQPEAGCCAGCGYDLWATPGRWPECGRETSPG